VFSGRPARLVKSCFHENMKEIAVKGAIIEGGANGEAQASAPPPYRPPLPLPPEAPARVRAFTGALPQPPVLPGAGISYFS
jgi:hypothetical protein